MSDFLNYYGKSEIDFRLKPTSKIVGGLNFQIIPCFDSETEDLENSLVVDEIAFSLIEDIFFGELEGAHWGKTKFGIEKLDEFYNKLIDFSGEIENLAYRTSIEVCTREIMENKEKYHPLILIMIKELVDKLYEYKKSGYKFICIWGI